MLNGKEIFFNVFFHVYNFSFKQGPKNNDLFFLSFDPLPFCHYIGAFNRERKKI